MGLSRPTAVNVWDEGRYLRLLHPPAGIRTLEPLTNSCHPERIPFWWTWSVTTHRHLIAGQKASNANDILRIMRYHVKTRLIGFSPFKGFQGTSGLSAFFERLNWYSLSVLVARQLEVRCVSAAMQMETSLLKESWYFNCFFNRLRGLDLRWTHITSDVQTDIFL